MIPKNSNKNKCQMKTRMINSFTELLEAKKAISKSANLNQN